MQVQLHGGKMRGDTEAKHAALEKRLGKTVAASTVYRILARHGWRKVTPDTCHPKRDAKAQEEFKKNSSKRWRKLPP